MTDLPSGLVAELEDRFGVRFSAGEAVRAQHSGTESYHASLPPQAVVFAQTTDEVAQVVRQAAAHGVPVIAHGAGTSLEGHLQAPHGGISIDLSRMDRVLRVSARDLDCTVEAGVTREGLNAWLRDEGLFFPIDPGANATIGGMAATRASGTNAVRYGTMRENVLGLTVVLADGTVVRTGGRARKSSAGYDLTRLFVGSEGTLGLITEVTLRLHGLPEATAVATCTFADTAAAIDLAIAVVQLGIPVARMEFLDRGTIVAVNRHSGLALRVADTLAFEVHGASDAVAQQLAQVRALAEDFGAQDFVAAETPEDRTRLWRARHNAYYATVSQRPNARGWSSDVCVPISELAGSIANARSLLAGCPVPASILGHVGDGNFHVVFALDPNDAGEVAAVKAINAGMVRQALSVGGTCSGEHGIGSGKRAYLVEEHGAAGMALMTRIKAALDPTSLLNPGKIL